MLGRLFAGAYGRVMLGTLASPSLHGFGLAWAIVVAFSASCAQPKVAQGAATLPNPVLGAPVDPEYQREYRALERAVEADPGGTDVVDAAERLLARDPPPELAARAHLAAAVQAYTVGRDNLAREQAQAGQQALAAVEDREVWLALARVELEAMARSGDPDQALRQLTSLSDTLDAVIRAGLMARIRERQGRPAEAISALAAWRDLVAADTPAAVYAEQRLSDLLTAAAPGERRKLADTLPEPARSCVRLSMGMPAAEDASAWVEQCRLETERVGVLLPRSGRYAALADTQLAAVSAAIEVLGRTHTGALEIIWEDAGDSPGSAVAGAQALLDRGAQVIVGPVGPQEIRAVGERVGDQVRVVVPGEGVSGTTGVAPSLEARVEALLAHVRAAGRTHVVIVAPDNGYGRRALAAARNGAASAGVRLGTAQTYPPDTTSFADVLAPITSSLDARTAVLVPDRIGRVELLLRQLRRMGVDAGPAAQSLMVITTGEGAREGALGQGHESLEGVWIAPVATASAETADFDRAYVMRQGVAPDDQALLVWQAVRAAVGGPAARTPAARVLQVQQGQLVLPSQTATTPRQ